MTFAFSQQKHLRSRSGRSWLRRQVSITLRRSSFEPKRSRETEKRTSVCICTRLLELSRGRFSFLGGPMQNQPVVVAYGMGVDSTAMLVGLRHQSEFLPIFTGCCPFLAPAPRSWDWLSFHGSHSVGPSKRLRERAVGFGCTMCDFKDGPCVGC